MSLTVDPAHVPQQQGYALDISSQGIALAGHDLAGVFYGVCTLNQLVRQFGATLPALEMHDYPDYPARGLMLDVGRHYMPVSFIVFPCPGLQVPLHAGPLPRSDVPLYSFGKMVPGHNVEQLR